MAGAYGCAALPLKLQLYEQLPLESHDVITVNSTPVACLP